MKEKTTENLPKIGNLHLSRPHHTGSPGRWMQRLCRHAFFHQLAKFDSGHLLMIDPLGKQTFGAKQNSSLQVTVWVHDLNLYWHLIINGSLGGAESYMKGRWSCSDLPGLIRIFARNLKVVDQMETGLARLGGMLGKGYHLLRKNTIPGSRANITAHYDLSNEFFQQFLDPSMSYSCLVFEDSQASLQEAAWAKNDQICKKLDLQPSDHLLEIGTGWGGFALHAAQHYGCQVTTTTISDNQYAFVREQVQQADLADQIEVLQEDYRCLKGQYNKLVSIEMIEAVGHQFFDEYFQLCSKLIKADGMMLLQVITIDDRQYELAKKSVDFIQRYIFPGGCLPSLGALCETIKNATDMRMYHIEDLASHYAKTLHLWRENFHQNLESIKKLGFSDEFIRMWDYYFSYCASGFTERTIGCLQILLTKPLCRRESIIANLS